MYFDLPRFCTWYTLSKIWKRRKKGEKIEGNDIHEAETIGRVYTVSPQTLPKPSTLDDRLNGTEYNLTQTVEFIKTTGLQI